MFYKVFHENKRLNLELESVFYEIVFLRSVHDDMSAKPCDNCKMIIVNYADSWLVYSHVASLLDGAMLEPRELNARSTLLGACTSYLVLRSDLEASAIEIKDLKHKLDHSSRYTVLSLLCVVCVVLSRVSFFMLSLKRNLLCACFMAVLVDWMSFVSGARELRRGALTMLETHIVVSSLIFCLVLIFMFRHAFLLVLCLISLMDLTTTHTVLVHERITLCLDVLVMTHILIVVIVSRVGLGSLLEGLTLTLS
jgi:hypothetical protein